MTHSPSQMPELKPCPFCGGEAKLTSSGHRHYVHCDKCGTDGPEVYSQALIDESPTHKWNTRAASVPCDDAPKRYWLIEQTDLDEDDDHRCIHTTDLDVYPNATILGEYVLKTDVPSDKERAEALERIDRAISGNEQLAQTKRSMGLSTEAQESQIKHLKICRGALTAPDKSRRIEELLEANNRYLQRARAAEETICLLTEALKLADATLSGSNMNLNVVEKKVKKALALAEKAVV